MNLTITHQKFTDLIEQRLEQLELPDEPSLIYEPVRYTLAAGGKRIRPYFVLSGCGICGGKTEEAIPAALAVELLHNFTLLHDDIMDLATTRRGKPTVFEKWDSPTAILSGDVMFAHAFKELQYYGGSELYSKQQYARLIDLFLESAEKVCEGQAYDLDFAEREHVTTGEYLEMIHGKTASLLKVSFMLGGVIAGADEKSIERLRQLGEITGTAFQIQDDLLDVVADPSRFGKVRGGDITEGKKTYLSVLALQQGSAEQKAFLKKIFSMPEVSRRQIDEVIGIYYDLGIIEKTKKEIDTCYVKAGRLLKEFPLSEYRRDLVDFLNKLKNREF